MKKLPLMEDFYTLQGEGYYSGHSAYFIRLAGCDVGCFWCDVKESWDASKYPQLSVEEIVAKASKDEGRLAVITGGEPLVHDLTGLCEELKNQGFQRNIETSGVYPISGEWEWICFSPKRFQKPLPEFYEKAHELKIVICSPSDLIWAEKFVPQMNKNCKLYLQVEWSKSEKMLPVLIQYIKDRPYWQLSLQTHKYIHIP